MWYIMLDYIHENSTFTSLGIRFTNGRHHVIEFDPNPYFIYYGIEIETPETNKYCGSHKKCMDYIDKSYIAYKESIIF